MSPTKRLVEAGLFIGIDIPNHIIIGDNKHLSMKTKGCFDCFYRFVVLQAHK